MRRGSRGFTLVESLVVLAILLVLALIAVGVRAAARRRDRAEKCREHLHKIGQGFTAYEAKFGVYPRSGPAHWFRELWESGLVTDPEVFRCPYVGGTGPGTDFSGLPSTGSYPGGGPGYCWTETGITDGAPPDLPMAGDGDTPRGPNHGSDETVNVLFFQGRVDSFKLGSPTEGWVRGMLIPSSKQWAAPAGSK